MKIILYGPPRTKKNSQQIVNGGRAVIQSKAYRLYEKDCIEQMRFMRPVDPSGRPFNARYVYYMPKDIKVDLVNLMEATNDILVRGGVLEEDNKKVIAAHDGSRVKIDKTMPRVEITLEPIEEVVLVNVKDLDDINARLDKIWEMTRGLQEELAQTMAILDTISAARVAEKDQGKE